MNLYANLLLRYRAASGRGRSIGLFFASSLLSRGIGTVCQLLQVPVALKYLGSEGFGLWMSLAGVGYFITFADFGLGQSVQNRLSAAFAKRRPGEQQDLFVNAAVFLTVLGSLVFAGGSLALRHIDLTRIFKIVDPEVQRIAPEAVRAMLVIICLNFPLGLGQRLAYSRQKGWLHNLSQAGAGVVSLLAITAVARAGGGLVATILAGQLPIAGANLVLLLVQFVQLGWIRRLRLRLRTRTMKKLLHLSGFFALQQLLTVVLFGLPQIVISTNFGLSAATQFNLAQRLFSVFAIVQNAFLLPLWPAYADAAANNDYPWMQKTLIRSIKATVLLSIVPMVGLTLLSRPVFHLWVGQDHELPAMSLTWLLCAWNCAVFIQQPFGSLLAGISEVRAATVYAAIGTVASITLMYFLSAHFGPQGVVASLILGFVPFPLAGTVLQTISVFHQSRSSVSPKANEPILNKAC